jgi:hypothetical protein
MRADVPAHRSEPSSVFASRIATSKPVWDKRLRLFRYDRFAAGRIRGTDDESKYEVDEDKGLIKVNWVGFDKAEVVEREWCRGDFPDIVVVGC